MKVAAILLATACLIGTVLAALYAWFIASFPWENSTAAGRHNAVVSLVLSALFAPGVGALRPQ